MITFNEELHKYFNGDKELISVTTLLSKHKLGVDYGSVDVEVLKKASQRGTAIHKEIEDFLTDGTLGWSQEFENFKKWYDANVSEVIAFEKMVYNDVVAGRFDFYCKLKNGRKTRIDFKTTYTVHKFTTAWQLSVYDYLDEDKTEDIAVLWLRNENCEFIPLKFVDKEEIDKLMDCERTGTLYTSDFELKFKVEELSALLEQKDRLDAKIEKLKADINEQVKKIGKYKNDIISITYVPETTTQRFDAKLFEKENQELYNKYLKDSVRKESYYYKTKEVKQDE